MAFEINSFALLEVKYDLFDLNKLTVMMFGHKVFNRIIKTYCLCVSVLRIYDDDNGVFSKFLCDTTFCTQNVVTNLHIRTCLK